MQLTFVERVTLDGFTYQAGNTYEVEDRLARRVLDTFKGGEVAITDTFSQTFAGGAVTIQATATADVLPLAQELAEALKPSAEAIAEVKAIAEDAAQELAKSLEKIESDEIATLDQAGVVKLIGEPIAGDNATITPQPDELIAEAQDDVTAPEDKADEPAVAESPKAKRSKGKRG